MKKYNIRFSLFNLTRKTQAEIATLQGYTKVFTAGIASTAWYTLDPMYSLYVFIGGYTVDFILHCIWLEEKI